jgi:hypothetical protein
MPDQKKALYEYEPRDLPDDQLYTLYTALCAKLMLTAEEIMKRHEGHAALNDTLNETDILNVFTPAQKQQHRDQAAAFRQSAQQVRVLHAAVVTELSFIKSAMAK